MKQRVHLFLWTGIAVIALTVGCASHPRTDSADQPPVADPGAEGQACCPGHADMAAPGSDRAHGDVSPVILITADGRLMMDNATLNPADLHEALEQRDVSPEGTITILAHPQAPFETVTQVAAQLRSSGYARVSVQVSE